MRKGKRGSMFKSRLQNQCQKMRYTTPEYMTVSEGPSHMPSFKSYVKINGLKFQSGSFFSSKKLAEDDAARLAFIYFTSKGSRKHAAPKRPPGKAQQSQTSSGVAISASSTTTPVLDRNFFCQGLLAQLWVEFLCLWFCKNLCYEFLICSRSSYPAAGEGVQGRETAFARPQQVDMIQNGAQNFAISQRQSHEQLDFRMPCQMVAARQQPIETHNYIRHSLPNQVVELYQTPKEVETKSSENDIDLPQNSETLQDLLQRHEAQNKELFVRFGSEWRKAHNSQKEDIEKFVESGKSPWKKLIAEKDKQIEALESQVGEKSYELESLHDVNMLLMCKEREANMEIQEARKTAIQILLKREDSAGQIAVRRMGELDQKPWIELCKNRYKNGDWQTRCGEIYSSWQEYLKDPSWYPFKVITSGDKAQRIVDERDSKLQELLREMGKDVYCSVINALKELNDYNASGRYPIPELWNVKEERRASLKEVIEFLNHRGPEKRFISPLD